MLADMTEKGPLLIDRGDLPSLTVAGLESNPNRLVLWHARGRDAGSVARCTSVRAHADVLRPRELIVIDAIPSGLANRPMEGAAADICMLMQATLAAVQLECDRVIWPLRLGPDFARVGPAVDRATAVVELLDESMIQSGPAGGLTIDLPLVELTREQVVELADDSGVPLRGNFWACEGDGRLPCTTCAGCREWSEAFDAVGVPWPWPSTTAEAEKQKAGTG
jgi:hypothetical protein